MDKILNIDKLNKSIVYKLQLYHKVTQTREIKRYYRFNNLTAVSTIKQNI